MIIVRLFKMNAQLMTPLNPCMTSDILGYHSKGPSHLYAGLCS